MKKRPAVLALWLAAVPAFAKPPMTEQMFEATATIMYLTEMCGVAGLMAIDTAAFGRTYVAEGLRAYDVGNDRVEQRVQALKQQYPTVRAAECNKMAMDLEQTKLLLQQRAAAKPAPVQPSPAPAQTYMPQFTTCNRVFGQVNCTTY